MLTTIRKATVNDKTRIMEIYAYARQFMAEHGNPNQWKNNNPSEETIDNDIAKQEMYVIEQMARFTQYFISILVMIPLIR